MSIEEKQQSAIYQTYIALGNLMTVCAIEKKLIVAQWKVLFLQKLMNY